MMTQNFILIISASLGFLGTMLVLVGYIPQIVHFFKERCSGGVSIRTYVVWSISSTLLGIHAIILKDPIFIFLQVANIILIFMIIVLAKKYETGVCSTHPTHR